MITEKIEVIVKFRGYEKVIVMDVEKASDIQPGLAERLAKAAARDAAIKAVHNIFRELEY
ncbi:MAG TPA: hypothetical protein VMW36_10875 [Patescibacteria group bacterium]|nr:hypothetical protein [Patescibacteria group bacterium]